MSVQIPKPTAETKRKNLISRIIWLRHGAPSGHSVDELLSGKSSEQSLATLLSSPMETGPMKVLRVDLEKLTPAELKAEEIAATEEYSKKYQERAWYNQSHCLPDNEYWARQEFWRIREAAALLVGRDPKKITPEKMRPLAEGHNIGSGNQFVFIEKEELPANYMDLIETMTRTWLASPSAVNAAPLLRTSRDGYQIMGTPFSVLEWAESKKFPIPESLRDSVTDMLGLRSPSELISELTALLEQERQDRQQAESEVEQLRAKVAELEAEVERGIEFDETAPDYPPELHAAYLAWASVSTSSGPGTAKQRLLEWLEAQFPHLKKEARQRMATVANWEKEGGRRKSGQE